MYQYRWKLSDRAAVWNRSEKWGQYIRFSENISVKVVDNTSQSLYDKVFKIIDIAGMVNPKGVLIFANLKSYFEKEELVEIYKYAVYNEVNVLTLEHGECEQPLSYEHIIYMDNDFEEYEW